MTAQYIGYKYGPDAAAAAHRGVPLANGVVETVRSNLEPAGAPWRLCWILITSDQPIGGSAAAHASLLQRPQRAAAAPTPPSPASLSRPHKYQATNAARLAAARALVSNDAQRDAAAYLSQALGPAAGAAAAPGGAPAGVLQLEVAPIEMLPMPARA